MFGSKKLLEKSPYFSDEQKNPLDHLSLQGVILDETSFSSKDPRRTKNPLAGWLVVVR